MKILKILDPDAALREIYHMYFCSRHGQNGQGLSVHVYTRVVTPVAQEACWYHVFSPEFEKIIYFE